MTVLRNTAEGGTVGVAPTVGNSGGASGDALYAVSAGSTGAVTVDNAHVKHDTKSYKIQSASPDGAMVMLNVTPNATSGAAQCYLYLTAYPTAQTRLMQFTSASFGRDSVDITNAGKLRWNSVVGTDVSMVMSVPLNQWVRISMVGDLTSSAVYLFTDAESLTPAEALTGLAPLNGDTFLAVRFGWSSTTSALFTVWMDTIEADGTATLSSPYASSKSDGDASGALDAHTAPSALLSASDTAMLAEVSSPVASLSAVDSTQSVDASALAASLASSENVAEAEWANQFLARTWRRLDVDDRG